MKPLNLNKTVLSALLAGFLIPCIHADVSIHENKISLHGYAAASASYSWMEGIHGEPNTTKGATPINAAKLGLAFDYSPVTARLSLYVPDTEADDPEDIYLLEANVTYRTARGSALTFGRFQSWIGYEAFDAPGQHFITAGTPRRFAIIPNFHEGIKLEGTNDRFEYGLALLDSIYPPQGKSYSGSGSLSEGYAIEARVAWKGSNLAWTVTGGYQKEKENASTDTWVADAYAEYVFPAWGTTLGAELCIKSAEPLRLDDQGNALFNNRITSGYGLVMVRQKMGAKSTLALRLSAGHEKAGIYRNQAAYDDGSPIYHGGTKVLFTNISMSFTYRLNEHLDIRSEAAYTDYTNTRQGGGQLAAESFLGMQVVFKF